MEDTIIISMSTSTKNTNLLWEGSVTPSSLESLGCTDTVRSKRVVAEHFETGPTQTLRLDILATFSVAPQKYLL